VNYLVEMGIFGILWIEEIIECNKRITTGLTRIINN
jgi:hypothetical protein